MSLPSRGARAASSTPSHRARRVGVALLAISALVLGATSASGAGKGDLKDKKHKVEKKLDQKTDDLDESSAVVKEATDALLRAQSDLATAQTFLAQTRGQLSAAQALDAQMKTKLEQAVQRLARAEKDLDKGKLVVAQQEDELSAMVVSTYEQGDPALMGLSMVLTTQDPAELAGQMNATATVVNKEAAILDHLTAAKVMLEVKEQETADAKAEVAKKRQEAADNLTRMKALETQAEQATQQVQEMVSLRAQARDNALQAKKADLKQISRLQAERDRIETLIAQEASHGSGYTGPTSGNGFLDHPVDGPITSPYGWRIHPIWGYRSLHDGDDFGAACGTPIRAAAAGKVLSEYYQTAWGNRLIIDHGVHYGVGVATISNHLSAYAVATGEHVKRGQVVGYVGTTGWSTGCHLHFTVLNNGTAVDPMMWF